MITSDNKRRIAEAIAAARANYPSDARHAASLGVSASSYSAVRQGQTERVLSDAVWVSIARKLAVALREEEEWKPARTATWQYVMAQLETVQARSLSAMLCDMPNIGKTFTARQYVATHQNAAYVDCSQVKSRGRMVRAIASEFGVDSKGRYADVYADLVYYLRSMERPLVVLDEAGDLHYEAFLELKALWNATEGCCAWYMMGADGLKEKIRQRVESKRVGYTEMLSRYGDRFSRVTPEDGKERERFLLSQARAVAKVNAPEGADTALIARLSGGGLRRVKTEIEKLRNTPTAQ